MPDATAAQSTVDPGAGGAGVARSRLAGSLSVALVLAVAVFFRLYELGRLPGVNGDEAWYGVQAHRWLSGAATDWRTPTGNIPGPLHMGLVVLGESLFPPSFALLRIPAVIGSLAAMAMAYAVSRRFFGPVTAIVALVMMAVLPINIAYARFGWDPSYSGLVVLAALYAALSARPYVAALVFAFAITVHPTNVFAAPFLGLAYLGALMEDRRGQVWREAILFAMLLVLAVFLIAATTSNAPSSRGVASIVERVMSPREWILFPFLFLQLLTGDSVDAFVTGGRWGMARPVADALAAMVFIGLFVAGLKRTLGGGFNRSAGIVAGWAAALIFFFLLAGNEAMRPHQERYGFVLVAPTVMMLAVLAGKAVPDRWRAMTPLVSAGLAVPLLASVWFGYFRPLERGDAGQHRAFWTGPVEPKEMAFRLIAKDAPPGGATVIAEDWWLHWPISYLARRSALQVLEEGQPGRSDPRRPVYWVTYRGSELERRLVSGGAARQAWTIRTAYPGHDIRIWRGAPVG